jgi:hypothetical protein
MDIVFCESGPALTPTASKRNANRIEDSCLARIIRADENRRVTY